MLTEEHLLARKKGIGGSEIAAIVGLCPYRTIWDIYLEKTSDADYIAPFNEYMKWGHLLEAGIASGYAQRTKAELHTPNTLHVHPEYPFLLGTPDYLIEGKRKGLEIKNVGYRTAKQWGLDGSRGVPIYYVMQVAHYMMVLDYDEWDVAALIGGNELRVYTIKRNKTIEKVILEEAVKFWHENVEKGCPPPVSKLHGTNTALLKAAYKEIQGEIKLDDDLREWKQRWLDAKTRIVEAELERKEAEAHLIVGIGEHETATFSDGSLISRKKIMRGAYMVNPTSYVQLTYKAK